MPEEGVADRLKHWSRVLLDRGDVALLVLVGRNSERPLLVCSRLRDIDLPDRFGFVHLPFHPFYYPPGSHAFMIRD